MGFLEISREGERDLVPSDVLSEGVHLGRRLTIGCGMFRVCVGPGDSEDEIPEVLRHAIRLGQPSEDVLAGEGRIPGEGVIGLRDGVLILLGLRGSGSCLLCSGIRERR